MTAAHRASLSRGCNLQHRDSAAAAWQVRSPGRDGLRQGQGSGVPFPDHLPRRTPPLQPGPFQEQPRDQDAACGLDG